MAGYQYPPQLKDMTGFSDLTNHVRQGGSSIIEVLKVRSISVPASPSCVSSFFGIINVQEAMSVYSVIVDLGGSALKGEHRVLLRVRISVTPRPCGPAEETIWDPRHESKSSFGAF